MQRTEHIQRFVKEIWRWYAYHKRTLPWRDLKVADDTQRAYTILVSEVMLQQTQVPRVQVVFKQFIERFPTIQDLAKTSNREVLIAWRGMGYNSRALRLRDAARVIVERGFPRSMEELLFIPGIGPYTAAAIRNFAFGIPTPCIDTNIRRILHRTFVGPEERDGTWKKDDAYLLKLAGEVLKIAVEVSPSPEPSGSSADRHGSDLSGQRGLDGKGRKLQQRRTGATWHAALMDFGSLVQTKTNPKWDLCPLTVARIMKTTPKNFPCTDHSPLTTHRSKEPGRLVGNTFIPNRIFRGKVVELLRDHPRGMTLERIGREICIDWSREHRTWLQRILQTLCCDTLLRGGGGGRYTLF